MIASLAMQSIYQIKPVFQGLLRPASDALWRVGITPNQVTVFAAALSLGAGSAIARFAPDARVLLLLGPVLFVRMALNAIDGMLAREHGMKTRSGTILNELGDAISDAALYLPLMAGFGFSSVLLAGTVVLAAISEMAGVVAAMVHAERRYDGPMGKSDRAVLFGAAGLALGCGAPVGMWQDVLLAAMFALLAVTIWNRARMALAEGTRCSG